MLWHIASDERVQRAVTEELEAEFGAQVEAGDGAGGDGVKEERQRRSPDLETCWRKLPYLEACLRETLRLYRSVGTLNLCHHFHVL